MKMRSRAVVDLGFVESPFEDGCRLPASRIGPAEDDRRVFALSIHTNETVPERTRRDRDDLTFKTLCFLENGVDSGDDVSDRFVGTHLASTVGRGRERLRDLYRGSRDDVGFTVIKGGANAR